MKGFQMVPETQRDANNTKEETQKAKEANGQSDRHEETTGAE